MARSAQNLTDHQKNQLIDTLMHYLPMDVRGKIIAEVPQAYNAYCGAEIVKVVHADGRVARA